MIPFQAAFDPRDLDIDLAEELAREVIEPLVRALRADGVEPMLGWDLERIADLQRRHAERMVRLSPANDPRWHPGASAENTIVLILDLAGADVGCIASRLVNCEGSVASAMVDGRFWYGRNVPPDHQCQVTAERAWQIEDRTVLYTASVFLEKSLTHSSVLAAMMRLHHVWAATHRFWSDGVGLAVPSIARRHAADVYGASEQGNWVFRAAPGESMTQFSLLWSSRKRARALLTPELGDLTRPIGLPTGFKRDGGESG